MSSRNRNKLLDSTRDLPACECSPAGLVRNLGCGCKYAVYLFALLSSWTIVAAARDTQDLGIVVERAAGSVVVVDTAARTRLSEITGLGDLSHASAVFSRDGRYAYVFGRDGGLTKIDVRAQRMEKRIVQAGNSIGGAISQDGKLVAVSNYEPGGVKVFDADDLSLVTDIPAVYSNGQLRSKVVGLVEAPANRFVFSLFDAGEIWVADLHDANNPQIRKFRQVGREPYDATLTPDGRYYIAALFGEDGMVVLDLMNLDAGVRRILDGYRRGEDKLPVYKMPHLEGCAIAGRYLFLPAVGRHELLVVSTENWQEVKRIPVRGQPVFAVARPDGRQVWVNFALPNNDTVQIVDVDTLTVVRAVRPGKAVLHMEFTARGEQVWVSVRDEDRVDVYDTETYEVDGSINAEKPSGIFFSSRASRVGT